MWSEHLFEWLTTFTLALAAVYLAIAVWWRRAPIEAALPEPGNGLLVLLPTALASVSVHRMAGMALIAVIAIAAATKPTHLSLDWKNVALPLIGGVIMLRPNPPATYFTAASFVVGCALVIHVVRLSKTKMSAVVSLVDGVGLFLAVSVALWLAGFSGNQGRIAGLENTITGGTRVTFPLSPSLPTTSAMAAIYVSAAMPILVTRKDHRGPRILALLCAGAVFVYTDSRAALLGAGLVTGLVLFAPSLLRRSAPVIVGATLALPFIYGTVSAWFADFSAAFPTWMVRRGERISSLNQRDLIWSKTLTFYEQHLSPAEQAFGFGAFGHAASGASRSYARGLTGLGNQYLITPHSSSLQILLDGGWVSLAAMGLVLVSAAFALKRQLPALAMLVTAAIAGMTEIAIAPSYALPTWWVVVALCVVAFAHTKSDREGSAVREHLRRPQDCDRP